MAEASFVRTDEQRMLATALREALSATVDMDRTRSLSLTEDAFDEPTWAALRDMGLIALAVEWGTESGETSFTDLAVVFEELGRVVAAVPLLSVVMAATLMRDVDSPHVERLVASIADGTTIPALALFEDAHSSDPFAGGVSAERSADGWRLVGSKRFVIDAPIATGILVTAVSDEGPMLVSLSPDDPGVDVEVVHGLDPTRPLGHVHLDAVVGDEAVLARGQEDLAVFVRRATDVGLVAMAQEQVGGSQRCLEMSVEYAAARYQFGRAIGSFQAIKHACADMLVAVEHARSAASFAASVIADEGESVVAVPLAHSVCSDAFEFVAGQTIQVHGGIGFTWEHDAHVFFKRAKASTLLLDSVDTSRDRLGDAIGV